jgi:purine nucleosidase
MTNLAAALGDGPDFWKEDVGRDGFYPFDLLAAAYMLEPSLFDCAQARAWIAPDDKLWRLFEKSEALIVGIPAERPESAGVGRTLVYCPEVDPTAYERLVRRLSD